MPHAREFLSDPFRRALHRLHTELRPRPVRLPLVLRNDPYEPALDDRVPQRRPILERAHHLDHGRRPNDGDLLKECVPLQFPYSERRLAVAGASTSNAM